MVALERVASGGNRDTATRAVAVERPVAIEVNGLGYAVLMATPADLADLGVGFALTERLIDGASDVIDIDVHAAQQGDVLRLTVAPALAERVVARVRHRTSDSSCGLCGIENLEQALRPLPRVTADWTGDAAAIFRAYAALGEHQALNRATGAVHAAAACTEEGAIRLVREDVGRHNAFDKLIGAMARAREGWDGGFALLTSRCSFELVEKAVLSGCPMLATISAPTSLALERARTAGLPLHTLVRGDALLAST
nr:formate dehydrogenase accessory sulfurtransferase FdhD [Sphingomonas guangdongensis]